MMIKDEEFDNIHCFDKFVDTTPSQNVLLAMAKIMVIVAKHYIVTKKVELFQPVMSMASGDAISNVDISSAFGQLSSIRHELLSLFLLHSKADFYIIASEAWSLRKLSKFDPDKYEHGDISRSPDKVSTFILSGESIGGDVINCAWEIEELGHARLIDFDKPMDVSLYNRSSTKVTIEGALHNLLELRRKQLHENKPVH